MTIYQLTGTATTSNGVLEETISWAFTPGCAASDITNSQNYPDEYIVSVDTELSFDIVTSAFSHEYSQTWIDTYGSDGCTISYRLEGDAASFTSISGTTVTIAPLSGIVPGNHDL